MSDETVKQEAGAEVEAKKRRGRPRKQKAGAVVAESALQENVKADENTDSQEKKVFRISRTAKIKVKKKEESQPSLFEEDKSIETSDSDEKDAKPDLREEELTQDVVVSEPEEEKAESAEGDASDDVQQEAEADGKDDQGKKKFDKYERYKNKKNGKKREDYPMEVNLEENPDAPKLYLSVLTTKHIDQLREQARGMGISEDVILDSRKTDLIYRMCRLHSQQGGALLVEGVLDIIQEGAYGYLRYAVNNYLPGGEDVYVSAPIIKATGLKTGDTVYGQIRAPRDGEKAAAMIKVFTVNGEEPKMAKLRAPFDSLTPLFPDERLHLEVIEEGKPSDLSTPCRGSVLPDWKRSAFFNRSSS